MNAAGWTPLTDIRDDVRNVDRYSRRPQRIRFSNPTGRCIPIRYWIDVLQETATWLVDNGRLTAEIPPIPHPDIRRLYVTFTTAQQHHPLGRVFKARTEIDDSGVYIDKTWEARDVITGSIELLELFEEDPSTIQVSFDRV